MKKLFLLGLCGFILTSHVAAQGVLYTRFDNYLPPTSLDLDGNGQADFSVNWSGVFVGTADVPQSFSTTYWLLSVLSGGSISLDGGNAGGVADGAVIGSTSSFWSGAGNGATLSAVLQHPLIKQEDWTGVLSPGASGLVGLSFMAQDGFTHYGWIRFRQPNPPPVIENGVFIEFGPQIAEFAWNTTANQSLIAGAVPEPTTWALLGMGCLALSIRRSQIS